jgi:acyl-CoA synthetase (AMP-forming)/AMP-acid ligase II
VRKPRSHRLRVLKTLRGLGMFRLMRPDRLVRSLVLLRRWGLTPAIAYGLAAIRDPDRTAIIDERGTLTFAEVDRRTNALARGLRAAGIDSQDTVAIMCRNHRGFIEATVACSKLGANVLYLNTASAGPEVAALIRRENPLAMIHDEEFSEVLLRAGHGRKRFIAWCDPDRHPRHPLLEELMLRQASGALRSPGRWGSTVTLAPPSVAVTSGAGRTLPSSLVSPGALLSRIPLRPRETTMVAAPMFCPWGFLHLVLGLRLASTLVLRREFDPEELLYAVDEHEVGALALVPEMLESVVQLPKATMLHYKTDSLRVIAVNGRALPSELAMPAMEMFGDVLYNLHGSSVVQVNGYWESHVCSPCRPETSLADPWLGVDASGEYVAHRQPPR